MLPTLPIIIINASCLTLCSVITGFFKTCCMWSWKENQIDYLLLLLKLFKVT